MAGADLSKRRGTPLTSGCAPSEWHEIISQGIAASTEIEIEGDSYIGTSKGATDRPTTALSSYSRAYTRPGTHSGRRSRATTVTSVANDSPNVICAICEARGVSPSVGIAFINLTHGSVVLSQLVDNPSYFRTIHQIHMMDPSKIFMMPCAAQSDSPNTLDNVIQTFFPHIRIDICDRSAWSDASGLDYIKRLAFQTDIHRIQVAIAGKFYAVASFSAVIKCVEESFDVRFVPHSLRLRYQPPEDTMMIDMSALQSLEIFQNTQSIKSKETLLGLLNHTLTPMGYRLLRNNVLQPSTQRELILSRSECVEELTGNEEMFREIRVALKPFCDIERVLAKFITASPSGEILRLEEQTTQVLMVKSFLEATITLHRALAPAVSELLIKQRDFCRQDITFAVMREITTVIEPDVTFARSALDIRNQRTFAVRSGIDGILDMCRQTYKEVTEEIHNHVDQLNQELGITASLKYDNGRKYWLRLKTIDFNSNTLPERLINTVQKKGHIECQTMELVKLNLRHIELANEVLRQSDSVIIALVQRIRAFVPDLFRMCEAVSTVDLVASFAQLSSSRNYVRPQITETLALKAARHPIVEKVFTDSPTIPEFLLRISQNLDGTFVPNDYYGSDYHRFHILTGCNMSGKSTYIRAIALLQVMAQVGCFVPAEFASFPIVPNIFVRVSTDDSIEASLSTFSVEMRETAFILRNIQPKSLVIIDELGRGTSTRDGLAVVVAVSETLIAKGVSVWFATHFADLSRVFQHCPGVLSLHLQSQCSTNSDGIPNLIMLYTVASGITDDNRRYGIHLAKAIGMPRSLIKRAEEVADDLRHRRQQNTASSEARRLSQRRNLILSLHQALLKAKDVGHSTALPGYLARLQEEFILQMDSINSH